MLDRMQGKLDGLAVRRRQIVAVVKRQVKQRLRREVDAWRTGRRRPALALPLLRAVAFAALLLPLGFVGWLGAILDQLVFGFFLPSVGFPVRLARWFLEAAAQARSQKPEVRSQPGWP